MGWETPTSDHTDRQTDTAARRERVAVGGDGDCYRACRGAERRDEVSITRIISGGQDGVDVAALRAAKSVGLATGGWMPKGFKTQSGCRPEYRELYRMRETASASYTARTFDNAAWPDSATLLLGPDASSPGMRCTMQATVKAGCFSYQCWLPTLPSGDIEPLGRNSTLRLIDSIVRWLHSADSFGVTTINVAGNRGSRFEVTAQEWVETALRGYLAGTVAP